MDYHIVRRFLLPFGHNMQVKKLSVSLPASLVQFIEGYKVTHSCKSRSQVIEMALLLLRQKELEEAYREASTEVDNDWDITIADGLTDEMLLSNYI